MQPIISLFGLVPAQLIVATEMRQEFNSKIRARYGYFCVICQSQRVDKTSNNQYFFCLRCSINLPRFSAQSSIEGSRLEKRQRHIRQGFPAYSSR
ncbi:hypothetical protein I7I48_04728 [Histoplasma ohiense]|nr:hypothetical protein I7I48_04728 [Histoplasma ohiense (nom. inval.)]